MGVQGGMLFQGEGDQPPERPAIKKLQDQMAQVFRGMELNMTLSLETRDTLLAVDGRLADLGRESEASCASNADDAAQAAQIAFDAQEVAERAKDDMTQKVHRS
jgi:hypothetical protein